jgi:hypothetical protein
MPVVRIDYEKNVDENEIRELAGAMYKIAAEVSERPLEEQSVYARPNHITVGATPIEIYVDSGPLAIPGGDKEKMLEKCVELVQAFRKEKGYTTPTTVSIVEIDWKVQTGL